MVDITGISNQPVHANRAADRSSPAARAKDAASSNASGSASDSVEISAAAKEGQSVNRLVSAAKVSPDVRADAVAKAKQTLEDGGFAGRDVSRKAAENILDQL